MRNDDRRIPVPLMYYYYNLMRSMHARTCELIRDIRKARADGNVLIEAFCIERMNFNRAEWKRARRAYHNTLKGERV